jgi:hypothetical protein
MNIMRTLAASALALTFGLGTALVATPSFASKDRVEHNDRQDRQDRADHSKSGDRNHDKDGDKHDNNKDGGDKGDNGGDNGDH